MFRKYYQALSEMCIIIDQQNFITYGASTTPTLVLGGRGGFVSLYYPGKMPYRDLSHRGEIYPSGFPPISAGNSLVEVYRYSPLFRALRDADNLCGKCGECEFRNLCGGSRSRSFALTGDCLAEDPRCLYQPKATNTRKRPAAAPFRQFDIGSLWSRFSRTLSGSDLR